MEPSLLAVARGAELGTHNPMAHVGNAGLVRRMCKSQTLEGHRGCVNRLSFSQDGRLLLSGSDDLTLRIWNLHSGTSDVISTEHSGNILGVRFMPQSGLVASGAMDGQLCVTDVETGVVRTWSCHEGTIMTVEVSPRAPSLVYTASEDGTVREFDLREPRLRAMDDPDASNVIVKLMSEIGPGRVMSAHLSPVNDLHMVVAASDAFVRVFDRRIASSSIACARDTAENRAASPAPSDDGVGDDGMYLLSQSETNLVRETVGGCVRKMAPAHLHPDAPEQSRSCRTWLTNVHTTYAKFSSDGSRIVASYFADNVYLFDTQPASQRGNPFPTNARRMAGISRHQRHQMRQEVTVRDLLRKGVEATYTGWCSHAIDCINRALHLDATHFMAMLLHADALLRRAHISDFRQALASIDKLIAATVRPSVSGGGESLELGMCPTGHGMSLPGDWVPLFDCLLQLMKARAIKGIVMPAGMLTYTEFILMSHNLRARERLLRISFIVKDVVEKLESLLPSDRADLWSGGDETRYFLQHVVFQGASECSATPCPHELVYDMFQNLPKLSVLLRDQVNMALEVFSDKRRRIDVRSGTTDGSTGPPTVSAEGGEKNGDAACDERIRGGAWRHGSQPSSDGRSAQASGSSAPAADSPNGVLSKKRSNALDKLMSCKPAPSRFWGPTLGYLRRYDGHMNCQTDIKEAGFFGMNDEVIMSGSDDACMYLWSANSGAVLAKLRADATIVNCVQGHPYMSMIATSGLDNEVRLWEPSGAGMQRRQNFANGAVVDPDASDIEAARKTNYEMAREITAVELDEEDEVRLDMDLYREDPRGMTRRRAALSRSGCVVS